MYYVEILMDLVDLNQSSLLSQKKGSGRDPYGSRGSKYGKVNAKKFGTGVEILMDLVDLNIV